MAVEKLQNYIDSVDELQKAHSAVKQYGTIIGEVSRYLNSYPHRMTISNAQVSFEVTSERDYVLDGDKWPSAKQLAVTLSDYIQKREKVKQLYDSLDEAQRGSVKAPPEI